MALNLLLLAAGLPLLSFAAIALAGQRLGRHVATLATAAAAGLFVLAGLAFPLLADPLLAGDPEPVGRTLIDWCRLPGAPLLQIGVWADRTTVLLAVAVGFVGTAVAVFSGVYMADDARPSRYYGGLSLFLFAMMGLLLADNLLTLFVFWELVGLCSGVLISHWFTRPAAAKAATKALLVNRIGDVGLLAGMALLLAAVPVSSLSVRAGPDSPPREIGPLSLHFLTSHPRLLAAAHPEVRPWAEAAASASPELPPVLADHTLLTVAGLLLVLGAAAKSAQFPLQIWLADAMEGPTPISALIHAATMVAAGVYLLARLTPILTPEVLLTVAHIGALSLTAGALLALVQTDLKRVLAWSTVSQLGLMMLAVGLAAPAVALGHLFAHAFFKSLLFLSAGAVRHTCGHHSELHRLDGLRAKLPITAWTFLFAAGAMAGLPPLLVSGFWSKEAVLATAWQLGPAVGSPILAVLAVLSAVLTPLYLGRAYLLTFEGSPHDLTAGAFEVGSPRQRPTSDNSPLPEERPVSATPSDVVAGSVAENPDHRAMWQPLRMLAVFCLFPAGLVAFGQAGLHPEAAVVADPETGLTALQAGLVAHFGGGPVEPLGPVVEFGLPVLASALALAGAAAAVLVWGLRILPGGEIAEQFAGANRALERGLFFDDLWAGGVRWAKQGSAALAEFDRVVIDGVVAAVPDVGRAVGRLAARHDTVLVDGIINHIARVFYTAGEGVRVLQTGAARQYVQFLVVSVITGIVLVAAILAPADRVDRLGVSAALAGLVTALVIRATLMPVQIGPTTATALTVVLAAGLVFEPGVGRVELAALLTGLTLTRLLRWMLTSPSAERTTAIPGTAALLCAALWLDSPLFVAGLAVGGVLELAFLYAPRRAANGMLLAAATAAGATIPETAAVRAAQTGFPLGMLVGHLIGWGLVIWRWRYQAEPSRR